MYNVELKFPLHFVIYFIYFVCTVCIFLHTISCIHLYTEERNYCFVVIFPAITLKIQGLASVRWEETRSESYTDANGQSQSRTVTDVYSSEELYFKNEVQLWGGGVFTYTNIQRPSSKYGHRFSGLQICFW